MSEECNHCDAVFTGLFADQMLKQHNNEEHSVQAL